jgi:hypothetical protein
MHPKKSNWSDIFIFQSQKKYFGVYLGYSPTNIKIRTIIMTPMLSLWMCDVVDGSDLIVTRSEMQNELWHLSWRSTILFSRIFFLDLEYTWHW